MKEVKNFLEANGFKKISTIHKASRKNTYFNDKCTIIITKKNYIVIDNDFSTIISDSLNIYWLIGILTYREFMDKNYKQLN